MAYPPVLFLSALLLAPAATSAREVTSWARPGVTFDDYRRDAVTCATQGYFRDVANDEPARRFIRGFQVGELALNGDGVPNPSLWRDSILRTQPDRQKRALHAIQVGDVETCLIARGYSPFTLTPQESATLARYRPGSAERHRYLHALASR